jgi:hypothetical protein
MNCNQTLEHKYINHDHVFILFSVQKPCILSSFALDAAFVVCGVVTSSVNDHHSLFGVVFSHTGIIAYIMHLASYIRLNTQPV